VVVIFLAAGTAFVIRFAGPMLLRRYVEVGIGDCRKIPILCALPAEGVLQLEINKNLTRDYIPYNFPKMTVSAPKGFSVVQEMIKKYYYKKKVEQNTQSIIYVLYEEKGYFPGLFQEAKKLGVNDNAEFLRRVMYALPQDVKSLGDAFFVIMKSIFIPDVGDQTKAVMARFQMGDKSGYIIYNLGESENYFNFDMVDSTGAYFKAYIKDKGAKLSLDDAFSIVSTLAQIKE